MKRRDFLFASMLTLLLPVPFLGTDAGRVPMPRMFALVYVKKTREVRRLVDTSDEPDDSHLLNVRKYLAADEVMELFPQHAFAPAKFGEKTIRWPRFVSPFIGRGTLI